MNRLRLLAVGTVLMFAMSTVAQQPPTSPNMQAAAVAPVDQHLKVLSEKLGLTVDQQDKARPILQAMHDGSQKLEDDQGLTPDQRQAAMGPLFMKADKDLRVILTDDQKKKLDEMEAQMHGGPHDGSNGSPSSSPQH
jgi:Spy/CpxP family protein refolding chaperone